MRSFKQFILVNLGIVLIVTIILCPKCFLTLEGIKGLLPNFIFSFCISSCLSFGGSWIEGYFDGKISWIEAPVKRLSLTAISYIIYSFSVSVILVVIYITSTNPEVTLNNIGWMRVFRYALMATSIALIIITVFIARSWLFEWKNAALEAEKLKSENLASQYQSLKDQLNPHFLFNSLNVLSNLVYESADKSADFIQQLSRIYRYVLDVQQEELVSLEMEIDFAVNYLSLQKIRFEQSLEFHIDEFQSKGWMIPPLSLQLLLENAIKHNVTSETRPLKIWIEIQNEKLIVKNNFQPKMDKETHSGIGLENISKRYDLLSESAPEIIQTEREFIVKLPLLKVSKG
ncbi:sensor histidine kinase [Belliella marina]|uniref:Sensor histidine kinase n=1 Tax=Belliella marina TaxID=1644146 RepID=A0ABW4VNH8_9BACT